MEPAVAPEITYRPTSRRLESLREKLNGEPDFLEEDYTPRFIHDTRISFDVKLVSSAQLPTRYGEFKLYGFYDGREGKEHTALVRGDLRGREDVPVRIHSECHTGDVWGSLRCDCREQLEAAVEYVAGRDYGAVVYMKQEGRGIGLLNKIKAYQLQDLGLDTIEANQFLGFPAEARDYAVAARILTLLEIESIALLSNNPDKITKLQAEGVRITRRVPIVIAPNQHNHTYLETKKLKMGHMI